MSQESSDICINRSPEQPLEQKLLSTNRQITRPAGGAKVAITHWKPHADARRRTGIARSAGRMVCRSVRLNTESKKAQPSTSAHQQSTDAPPCLHEPSQSTEHARPTVSRISCLRGCKSLDASNAIVRNTPPQQNASCNLPSTSSLVFTPVNCLTSDRTIPWSKTSAAVPAISKF